MVESWVFNLPCCIPLASWVAGLDVDIVVAIVRVIRASQTGRGWSSLNRPIKLVAALLRDPAPISPVVRGFKVTAPPPVVGDTLRTRRRSPCRCCCRRCRRSRCCCWLFRNRVGVAIWKYWLYRLKRCYNTFSWEAVQPSIGLFVWGRFLYR